MTPHEHATRIVESYMRNGLGDPRQSTDHAVATAVAYLELEPRFAEAKQNSEEADKISEFHIAERDHLQSLLEATEECCNNLKQRLRHYEPEPGSVTNNREPAVRVMELDTKLWVRADDYYELQSKLKAAEARVDTAKAQADDYLEVAASRGHTIAKMIDERDSLTQRLATAEADATRYRWLKATDPHGVNCIAWRGRKACRFGVDQIDQCVDAAMGEMDDE